MKKFAVAIVAAVGLAAAAFAQDNVYFGNLHAHTVYSDGTGTPEEAYTAARAAGLDFMAVTEHSHSSAEGAGDTQRIHIARDHRLYNGPQASSLISAARRHTVPGQFVAIYGQEYSTISHGNHVNVFEVPEVIDVPNGRFRDLIAWTMSHPDSSGRPALLQLNHPALADEPEEEYGRDDFGTPAAWLEAMDGQAELIEVYNGPAMARDTGHRSAAVQEADYYYYLNLGFHLAPSVGHDNHYRTWGRVTDARVAVIAPSLTKENVLNALRARHAYATSDRNLRIVFRAGPALQGDVVSALPPANSDLALTLSVRDDDEPQANYRIDVFSDVPGGEPIDPRRAANSFLLHGNTATPLALDGVPFRQSGQYVLVRVTQLRENADQESMRDIAWTAPIWFGGADSHSVAIQPLVAPLTLGLRLTRVLPNPAGVDLLNEKIWLRNNTNTAIDLSGWELVDLSGNVWRLSGRIGGGEERAFRRDGETLSLNNGGDRLELRDPAGAVVQVATYGPARAGEEIPIQ